MKILRGLIGAALLASVAGLGAIGVQAGQQESPGLTSTGQQESPGALPEPIDNTIDLGTDVVVYLSTYIP